MFRALFCKELKNRRWYFVGGVVIFSAIALVIPSNYFGVFLLLQNIEFSTYVWGSWWGQGLWQLGFVYALLLGISSFEAEAREGVMEFLLTRNVTRCSVLAAKMLADMVILWLVAAVSTLALFMAAHYSGIGFTPPYSLTRATVFTGISFLVPYVIALLGVMVTGNKLIGFGLGVSWIILDITVLLRLREGLSLLHYIGTLEYYLDGGFPVFSAFITMAGVFILSAITYDVYRKKEL